MEKNFNIHVAINLNGGEPALYDKQGNFSSVDFKTAFSLANDPSFLWGYEYPEWAECLYGNKFLLTKREFKKRWSNYRRHLREMNEIYAFGHGSNI